MSTFEQKLRAQQDREATILKVCSNFSKENKKRLKIVTRLADWYVRIEDLWSDFKISHDELTEFEQPFIASDYFTNRTRENIQSKVESMKEKIKSILVKLGKPIESLHKKPQVLIEETVSNEEEEHQSSSQESDDIESEANSLRD